MQPHDSYHSVHPFFFDQPPGRLFGCHHLPRKSPARSCGVVICQPLGHEYVMAHRSFYQLALRLANLGFHVLRFDYFGCGDSSGEMESGSLTRWVGDIQRAAGVLAERSQQRRVALVGLRMGAAMALMAAVKGWAYDALVLWEPVLDGRRYLAELDEMQRSFARKYGKRQAGAKGEGEVLGFPMTEALRGEFGAIQSAPIHLEPNLPLLAVWNRPEQEGAAALRRTLPDHREVEQQVIEDPQIWREEVYKRLIPAKTIGCIVNWADKVLS